MGVTTPLKRKIDWAEHESFTCKVCGANHKTRVLSALKSGYRAVLCQKCGVTAAQPMPTKPELVEYYSHYHGTDEPKIEEHLIELHSKVINELLTHCNKPSPARFLDYGFGKGAFLKKAAAMGVETWGMEFSDETCDRIEKYNAHAGTKIKTINLARVNLDSVTLPQFHCITLFQVIEHIVDPIPLIASLTRFLAPGGILYLECPNQNAFYLKLKNSVRKYFDREDFYGALNPPQHVHGFTKSSLRALIERVGLEPVKIDDYAYADGYHQPETVTFYPSVSEWLRNPNRGSLYSVAKTLIKVMEAPASRLLGAGGGLYAVARKK